MSDIKYQFASLPSGETVSIETVSEECRGTEYRCLGCGRPMSFVLQKKHADWQNYFRHKEGGLSCHPNRYLHKLAEIKIKERFDDRTKPFCVEIEKIVTCSLECEAGRTEKCQQIKTSEIDLHLWYDTCTPEQRVSPVVCGSSQYYVADLKLTHSEHPKREPVIIEVWVTHENTEEKRASGLKIIEVRIPNEPAIGEDEIAQFCARKVVAPCETATLTNFKQQRAIEPMSVGKVMRVDLFKSGKLKAYEISCKQMHEVIHPWAVYSVNVLAPSGGCCSQQTAYSLVRHRLQQRGVSVIRNCRQCWFHSDDDYYGNLICKRYKTKGTPHYLKGDEATYCPFFGADRNQLKQLDEQMTSTTFVEVAPVPERIETVLNKMTPEEKQAGWEKVMRDYEEESVWTEELADQQRLGLEGAAAIKHYNE